MSLHSSPFARVALLLAGYGLVGGLVFFAGLRTPLAAEPEAARDGARVWRENNCQACHAIYGLGGHLGPDLTNFIRRRGDAYGRAVLAAGRPGMPTYALSPTETDRLMLFLAELDRSGRYPLAGPDRPVMGDLP